MVFPAHNFEQYDCSIHVLKGLAMIAATMVIQGKVAVAVSCLTVVVLKYPLLKDNTFRLQFYRLQEVSKLELDTR